MRNFITNFLAIIVMLIFEPHHPVVSLSPIHQKTALFQFQQSLTISTSSFDVCYILQRRYDTYASPSHPKTKNWSMSSDHCTWEGVSCDHETGDVIGLDLSCSRLEGAILPNSTLFQLSHLHFLNLSNNDFSLSNQFPREFSYFAKGLTHLNLSYTRFSGRVPTGISHLYKLVSLDLSYNFNTKLEDEVFKSVIQNLTQLRVLNLDGVNINSVLPVNLSTSLRVLNLMDTGLYGVLPLFHLPNLEVLDLSSVNSVLPMNLSTSLRVLNLGNTGLYGVLPQEVFHLPNLERLDLSDNTDLTVIFPKVKWGSSGSLQYLVLNEINFHQRGIPDSIGFLDSLATLDLLNCNFSGQIPKSIGNLGQLTSLGLDGNNLNGPIPKSMGNLSQLTVLGLGGNNLNGPIPKSMGNLSQLTILDLGGNNLSGPIPKSMGKLGQLTFLYLGGNNFNGSILTILANLTNLGSISLKGNNFTGPLFPELLDNLSLESLDISHNRFTGSLPLGLFNHSSLEYVDISYNGFTGQLYEFDSSKSKLQSFSCGNNLLYGPIPQSVSQLLNLTYLDFSLNNFSGVLDFKMFSRLESLQNLDLSHNSLSVMNISMVTLPHKLWGLGLSSCNMKEFPHFSRDAGILLDSVDLSNNDIDGEFPHWIGSVDTYLNLSHNRLTGGLGQLPWNNIQCLDLQSNKLIGSLPTLLCNSSYLQILNLSNNSLSGVLPICRTYFTSLWVLDLRMNNFQGNIPATLSNFLHLRTINFHGNKLEGRIPSSFVEFHYLQVLDLGNNQINDTFPQCLEALPNLHVLVLKSNKFHGIINTMSRVENPFPRLRIIDLSYNEFSGPLPAIYFRNFKAMMDGGMNKIERSYMGDEFNEASSYSDSTFLVVKGREIEFVRILTVLTTIDVSRNSFEGEILEYIGDLVSLRYLNLSHNHLTGHIPSSIGNLTMLESLDLSSNQLQGEIPHQLTSIYSLASLNLSCNQLRGHIPEGSQFNTFENDSYVGNLGLCGHPLSKKCEINVGTQEEDDGDEDYFFSGFTWEAVVIGYGCGVVPAFIAGYFMLLAGKPKWFAGIIARELGLKIRRMEIKWR